MIAAAELLEAKAIFDKYDKDRSGFITTRELRVALKGLGLQVWQWLSSTALLYT